MQVWREIENYLLKEQQERKMREMVSHYPSSVSRCKRQLYYKMTGIEPTNPPSVGGLLKMKMGNFAHDMVQELLDEAGLDFISEVSFKKHIEGLTKPISGRLDHICVDKSDDSMGGIEVKSKYGRGVRDIQTRGYPNQSDIEQVIIYFDCLPELDWFKLVYLGRDDMYRTEFHIDIRNDHVCCNGKPVHVTAQELYDELRRLEEHVESKELPEQEYKQIVKNGECCKKVQKNGVVYKSDWQCGYCDYRDLCWKFDIEAYQSGDNIAELFHDTL